MKSLKRNDSGKLIVVSEPNRTTADNSEPSEKIRSPIVTKTNFPEQARKPKKKPKSKEKAK